MEKLIENATRDLISQNGSTTTLEVKNKLIVEEPDYYWRQSRISQTLASMSDRGELIYSDNGVYRTYMDATTVNNSLGQFTNQTPVNSAYTKIPLAQRQTQKVTLTTLAQLVSDNAGKFATLTHRKRTDKSLNTMNCQILKHKNSLGAFQVKEQGQLKSVYPTDLVEVRLGGTVYKLK